MLGGPLEMDLMESRLNIWRLRSLTPKDFIAQLWVVYEEIKLMEYLRECKGVTAFYERLWAIFLEHS